VARRTRLAVIAALVVLAGATLWWLSSSAPPRSPEQRREAAQTLADEIGGAVTVTGASFVATQATADLGISGGVHLVGVRILDELHLDLTIEARHTVALGSPLRVCLVGPYSAPDDAGLSDPCWGEPELGSLVAAQITSDASGHPQMEADPPIRLAVTLRRGDTRCDYPPGDWTLEITASPMVDGTPADPIHLAPVGVAVPFDRASALSFLPVNETRYCGLASVIHRDQGEPPLASPR